MRKKIFGVLLIMVICWALTASMMLGQSCDLNSDSVYDVNDFNLAENMVVGSTACTASGITGACNAAMVQRVVNAIRSLGNCIIGTGSLHHSVSLSWTPSVTQTVIGNYVYRGGSSGTESGTPINGSLITGSTYLDLGVTTGQTYYYYVKAFDGTNYSDPSTEVTPGIVPNTTISGGNVTVSSVSAAKGTTAIMAMNLTNDLNVPAAGLQFTVTVPTWASKTTVTVGSNGKPILCKNQKPGPSTLAIICSMSDVSTNTMSNGVVANINIPIPTTGSGSATIALSATQGASQSADAIPMVAAGGKLTIVTGSLRSNPRDGSLMTSSTAIAPPGLGAVTQPSSPVSIPTPRLSRFITCNQDKKDCITCRGFLDIAAAGVLLLAPFSSNTDLVELPESIEVGAEVKEFLFEGRIKKHSKDPIIIGVSLEGGDHASTVLHLK